MILPPLNTVIKGHVLDIIEDWPDESIHCIVTSPPYWGLRDYGLEAQIWDARPGCEHEWQGMKAGRHGRSWDPTIGDSPIGRDETGNKSAFCLCCNAWRGSLGLEPTPELYVKHIVDIGRELRRVLRKDGTLWLNMGDSYATGAGQGFAPGGGGQGNRWKRDINKNVQPNRLKIPGLKSKDLCMIPSRVALALQADGWWMRSEVIEEVEFYCPCGCGHIMEERIWRYDQDREIIWKKPNPMPESAKDRPTTSHEKVFLLTKSTRYYYDYEAVKEPVTGSSHPRGNGVNPKAKMTPVIAGWAKGPGSHSVIDHNKSEKIRPKQNESYSGAVNKLVDSRNLRSVWTIATQAFPRGHFATFPEKLIEPCVKAGISEKGYCAECGAPWVRVIEKTDPGRRNIKSDYPGEDTLATSKYKHGEPGPKTKTTGWEPSCNHWEWHIGSKRASSYIGLPREPLLGIVYDPFYGGSGRVGKVALRLGCNFLGTELNQEYVDMANEEIEPDLAQKKLF